MQNWQIQIRNPLPTTFSFHVFSFCPLYHKLPISMELRKHLFKEDNNTETDGRVWLTRKQMRSDVNKHCDPSKWLVYCSEEWVLVLMAYLPFQMPGLSQWRVGTCTHGILTLPNASFIAVKSGYLYSWHTYPSKCLVYRSEKWVLVPMAYPPKVICFQAPDHASSKPPLHDVLSLWGSSSDNTLLTIIASMCCHRDRHEM